MRIPKNFISLMSFMLGFIIGFSLKMINVTSKLGVLFRATFSKHSPEFYRTPYVIADGVEAFWGFSILL